MLGCALVTADEGAGTVTPCEERLPSGRILQACHHGAFLTPFLPPPFLPPLPPPPPLPFGLLLRDATPVVGVAGAVFLHD